MSSVDNPEERIFIPERAQNPHFEQSDFADFGCENQQG